MRITFKTCFLFFLYFLFVMKAQALTIAPALIEVVAEPGEELVQKLQLFNETNQPLTVYPSTENFQPQKDTNLPEFLGNENPFGPARWLLVPAGKIELKQGQLKEFLIKIKIPALAEPGGHYAALLWSETPPRLTGIGTASRLANLFLFKIKGEIKEDLATISFEKRQTKNQPLHFSLRLENYGNVHLKPGGVLEVLNWRNKKAGEIVLNPLGQAILPQSQRSFNLEWQTARGTGGFFWVKGKIFYGAEAKELKLPTLSFWFWPAGFLGKIIGMAAVMAIIVIGILLIKRRIRNKESGIRNCGF